MLEMNSSNIFRDQNEFSMFIEAKVHDENLSYLEAIVGYCEEQFLDPEDIKPLISKTLKDKLEEDFKNAGLLKRTNSLDSFFL